MSGIRLKKSIIYSTFSLLLCFTQIGHTVEKDVHIGVLAIWGEKISLRMWQPTMNYLNKTIPGHNFILKPLKLGKTAEVVKQNNIDFILTNPGNYIDLEARFGISRLATLKTIKQNQSSSQFGAVIFTRHDRNDIQSLEDLRNKSFMAVKENAFGGFQMAWLELKHNDINPFEDFSSLQFSGFPQDKVVYAVLNGKIDAGTVRTTTLERMAAERLIDIKQFKIINHKIHSHFPFIHSTQLYPEWPIAKLKHTPAELAKAVSTALLKLPENSQTAKQAKISGWTIPLDYFLVRNLFKELDLAPYKTKLPGFIERYWLQLILFMVFVLQPIFLYTYKLRMGLRREEEKLVLSETKWATALDFLDEPMYMVDLDDRIIRANKAFYKKVNSNAEIAVDQIVTDFTHPEGEKTPCKVCQARKDLIDSIITLEADDPVNKAGVPMEISVKVIRNKQNKPIGIIQKMQDLTESRKAEKTLRRSQTLFKELLNATPDPLVVSDTDGVIILINTQFEKEFGYKREKIIGQKIETIIPKESQIKHAKLRSEYSFRPDHRPMGQVINLKALHKDGHVIPVDISLNPFNLDNEALVISIIHNITAQLEKETELKRLASFPESSPIPVLEFKKNKTITYANPVAIKLFPGVTQLGFKHDIFSELDAELSSLEKYHELTRNIRIDNSTFEQKITYSPETKLFRMYIWDITTLKNLTQKMSYQASHDALTNLINRREFSRRLEQITEDSRVNHKTHALCFMDLDRFKVINDTCGHIAGDELLKQLTNTLSSKIRENDTLARLGGDEFGLILAGCPLEKAKIIAKDLRKTVEDFRFHWDKKIFKIGISIGIAMVNNQIKSAKEVLTAADTACYLAKKHGRNQVHVYDNKSTSITKYTSETNWLNRINSALDNNNFVLYFQKIVSLQDKNHEHYEVLIRMLDEHGKIIPPDSFIPAAERFDVMSSVDSWVIKNILLIMQEESSSKIHFSINLSGQSISNLNFMNNCISQLSDSGVDTSRICFEITETAMIENLTNARRSISSLRGLGCKIALDDFGSGLSSFAYLKNLPVDYMKIDGSLIKDIENDQVNISMVKSIIQIGQSMGLETIAEYVENKAILKILDGLGIDYVQGYEIARPVPLDEIKLAEIKPKKVKQLKAAKIKL